ncbi:MAG: diaminopimelate epimerase [Myxococcales bacterium]
MIPFTKYHGLGNDFLLVDGRGERPLARATAIAMCNRRFGIGADGVLIAEHAGPGEDAHIRMRIVNPDGTEPEMCGNGLRCFVKYAVDRLEVWSNPLRVQTGAGLRVCDWTRGADGLVDMVSVSMGPPMMDRALVPMTGDGPSTGVTLPLSEGGAPLVADGVSMGNPHAVLFGSADPDRAASLGPQIQALPLFPEGVNVGFAEVVGPRHLRLVVYERGCGLTLACGTGACAAVAAATRRGQLTAGDDVRVDLPGGSLAIRLAPDWSDVRMTGPATLVCDGQSWL